jgi:hypothetical protein
MYLYEEMIKFINQAIEWKNLIYFVYPYFWDIPLSWDFIRQIRHSDAIRQAFLRAGSARVVLSVRQGWEADWIQFVETGGFDKKLLAGHPYMSIASEIASYDRTNYPGIPAANPGSTNIPESDTFVATTCSELISPSPNPVTITVDSSAGFLIGYTAIVDSYDSKVEEAQKIVEIPDSTHLTLARLDNRHYGGALPIPVLQGGESGQLVAEWFEYTPTSGTDIAITSDLSDMA